MSMTEKLVMHYTIWFGIYLGAEMKKSTEVCRFFGIKEPEEINILLSDWANEFVAQSEEDDSCSFFEKKLAATVPNRQEKDNIVYVVTGNAKNDDGSDSEWLVDIYRSESRASACAKALQEEADSNVSECGCDPIRYLVENRLLK